MLIVNFVCCFSFAASSFYTAHSSLLLHLSLKKLHKVNLLRYLSFFTCFLWVHDYRGCFFNLSPKRFCCLIDWNFIFFGISGNLFVLFEGDLFLSLVLGLRDHFLNDKLFITILIDFFCSAARFLTAHTSSIHLFLQQLQSLLGFENFALSHVDFHVVF